MHARDHRAAGGYGCAALDPVDAIGLVRQHRAPRERMVGPAAQVRHALRLGQQRFTITQSLFVLAPLGHLVLQIDVEHLGVRLGFGQHADQLAVALAQRHALAQRQVDVPGHSGHRQSV
jgi:hypothetical protein